MPLHSRQSRRRRQSDRGRATTDAAGNTGDAPGLCVDVWRRLLALRGGQVVLHRIELAGDEYRVGLRSQAVRLVYRAANKSLRQAAGAVPAQAAVSERARRPGAAVDLDPLYPAAGPGPSG